MQRLVPYRHGSGKSHVVFGTADRQKGRKEGRERLGYTLQYGKRVKGICRQGQVRSVLLSGADRKDCNVDATGNRIGDFR